jgi:hypothetical protein
MPDEIEYVRLSHHFLLQECIFYEIRRGYKTLLKCIFGEQPVNSCKYVSWTVVAQNRVHWQNF